jgi:hypothetical protein
MTDKLSQEAGSLRPAAVCETDVYHLMRLSHHFEREADKYGSKRMIGAMGLKTQQEDLTFNLGSRVSGLRLDKATFTQTPIGWLTTTAVERSYLRMARGRYQTESEDPVEGYAQTKIRLAMAAEQLKSANVLSRIVRRALDPELREFVDQQ